MESSLNVRTGSSDGQTSSPDAQLGTKFGDRHSRHEAWMDAMRSSLPQPLSLDSAGVYKVEFGDTLRTIAERLIHMRGEQATKKHIDKECDRLIQLNKDDHPSLQSNPKYLAAGLEYGGEQAWHLRTTGAPRTEEADRRPETQPALDNTPVAAPAYEPTISPALADNGLPGNYSPGAGQIVGSILNGLLNGFAERGFDGYHRHWHDHSWYPRNAYGGNGGAWPNGGIGGVWPNGGLGTIPNDPDSSYLYASNNSMYGEWTPAYSIPISSGTHGARYYSRDAAPMRSVASMSAQPHNYASIGTTARATPAQTQSNGRTRHG
jgi:hypothetical protein